jgi:OOP family OmpA-OmpF porin
MSSIKLSAILAAALLAGCAENDISNLEDMKREGKDFARHLANEYEMYAKKSSRDYNDFIDASHFAVKGQQATTGLNVLPEDPRDWDVPASSLKELLDARERLTFALDNGVRADFFASMAAKTQVSYDCWVQEVEEMNLFRGRPDQLNKCKDMFLNHIKSLESAMAKEAPMFVVHFGENSAMIGAKDAAVLDNIAKVSKHLDEREVMITGYTDGKGGRKSNLALSQKRADAVRDELVKRGVLENRITSRGVGEGFRGDSPSHRKVVIQIR